MKKLSIIHLGVGKVGKVFGEQLISQLEKIKNASGVSIEYKQKFNSKNSRQEIEQAIEKASLPFVLIDTTASDQTNEFIFKALKRGGFVILANKKPLSGEQKDFDLLHSLGRDRLFYECAVGAGLPVIRTIKDLQETGDEIIDIQGCFSGTLGYLFSEISKDRKFSEVVNEANVMGYMEPDMRDDLSGKDVARKAVILSRVIGQKTEIKDIELEGLYPQNMDTLKKEDFKKRLGEMDDLYTSKSLKAKAFDKVLRFMAKVNHVCRVGVNEVDRSSEIGSLIGTDNIFVIKTKRYFNNPLVIKGPGAGVEVTAAGVFSDLLSVVRVVSGGGL